MKSKFRQHFKAATVTGILLLCVCITLMVVQLRVHASTTLQADDTPTVTNTATGDAGTPTVTVTVIPTATATSTPTPVPTSNPTPKPTAPPKPTQPPAPTVAPTTPTPTSVPTTPGNTTIFNTPTAAATLQPTPHAKATPTPSPVPTDTPTATPTAVSNASSTDNSQNTGGGGSIANPTTISVAAGAVLLLLIAGVFGLMQMRKQNTHTALAGGGQGYLANNVQKQSQNWAPVTPTPQPLLVDMPQTANRPNAFALNTPAPAMHMEDEAFPPLPSFDTVVSTFSGKQPAIVPPAMVPPAMMSTPPMFNRPGTPQNLPVLPEPYRAGDLRPITTELPKQTHRPENNRPGAQISPISTSDMNSLLPDGFDLTQILISKEPDWLENRTTPVAEPRIEPSAKVEPPIAPVISTPVIPPSIQDDPVLETIMRQAQMGLYAHPDQNNDLNDTQQRKPGNNSFLL